MLLNLDRCELTAIGRALTCGDEVRAAADASLNAKTATGSESSEAKQQEDERPREKREDREASGAPAIRSKPDRLLSNLNSYAILRQDDGWADRAPFCCFFSCFHHSSLWIVRPSERKVEPSETFEGSTARCCQAQGRSVLGTERKRRVPS